MTSKIKIKLGPVEVEYEGSEDFLKKELPELLSAISKLYRDSGITESERSEDIPATLGGIGQNVVVTTGTIAAKLKATTASDLALAAAARMIFGGGQESFTRDQLLKEMKTATSYFKKSYTSNLTKTLNSLVKSGKFVEIASNTYALSANTKSELGAQLAS